MLPTGVNSTGKKGGGAAPHTVFTFLQPQQSRRFQLLLSALCTHSSVDFH